MSESHVESHKQLTRACRSLARLGAALQVLSILILIVGAILGVAAIAAGDGIMPLISAIVTAFIMYAVGAVFDFFNYLGLLAIGFAEDEAGKRDSLK